LGSGEHLLPLLYPNGTRCEAAVTTRDEALAELRASREALRDAACELRRRSSPHQLAGDAIRFLDPELTMLARLKAGVREKPLLSLAVLAGVGWLLGTPRRRHGAPQDERKAESAPMRKTTKEKNNDSGSRRAGSGNGARQQQQEVRPHGEAEIGGGQRGGKARAEVSRLSPQRQRGDGKPQQRERQPEELAQP
jgi:hypothetical protein